MTCFICENCGTQHAERLGAGDRPPTACRVCLDDRQYVAPGGQRWTTHTELVQRLHQRIEMDGDLLGVGIAERFAIPQRALVVPSDVGNVLWDCVSVVTPEAVRAIRAMGGLQWIAISHPHFYSSMVEWSRAFGDVPILLHAADAAWIARPSANVRLWSGDEHVLSSTVRLVHLPGHFPGSAVLHWTAAPHRRRALLVGDSLLVAADRRHVSVMHSVPNYVPVGPAVVQDVRRRLAGLAFDDVYGFAWGGNIIGDARAAVDASLDRYLAAVAAPRARHLAGVGML